MPGGCHSLLGAGGGALITAGVPTCSLGHGGWLVGGGLHCWMPFCLLFGLLLVFFDVGSVLERHVGEKTNVMAGDDGLGLGVVSQ